MKRILLLLMATFTIACSFAQSDMEIVRRCSYMDIEGERFDNVVITLKSYDKNSEPFLGIKGGPRVKVTVKDNNGKKVYKKTFKNSHLYISREGEIEVGQWNFLQLNIFRVKGRIKDSWFGVIREKEGIDVKIVYE